MPDQRPFVALVVGHSVPTLVKRHAAPQTRKEIMLPQRQKSKRTQSDLSSIDDQVCKNTYDDLYPRLTSPSPPHETPRSNLPSLTNLHATSTRPPLFQNTKNTKTHDHEESKHPTQPLEPIETKFCTASVLYAVKDRNSSCAWRLPSTPSV